MMVFDGGKQAFCGNNRCTSWTWNATKSLDENLLDVGVVQFSVPEDDGPPAPAG